MDERELRPIWDALRRVKRALEDLEHELTEYESALAHL
jgi:hypothetical protein